MCCTSLINNFMLTPDKLFSTLPDLRKSVLTAKPTLDEQKGEYDPKKRDPQFAHATASPMWELVRTLANPSLTFL
jgi:hypothetical protein